MKRPIRFLIPLFLILAAAQIGRLRAEEPTTDLTRLVVFGDLISTSRISEILHDDALDRENLERGNLSAGSRLDEVLRTLEFPRAPVTAF